MQVILPFLSRFLVISGFLADTRPPLVKPMYTEIDPTLISSFQHTKNINVRHM
jgi:hypothetical protein